MKLLSKLVHLGKVWHIKLDPALEDDGELGKTLAHKCLIVINPNQSPDQLRDTLWHEIFHACAHENGLQADFKDDGTVVTEEMMVRRMSTSSLAFLRENPKLREILENKK